MLKSTRKIVSLILVLLLLCSLAVAVSADSQDYGGRAGNCFFNAYSSRDVTLCSGVLEVSPINDTSYEDYILRVALTVYQYDAVCYDYRGTPAIEHATNAYRGFNSHAYFEHYINESRVHRVTISQQL